jgi:predicted transcriptional regulator
MRTLLRRLETRGLLSHRVEGKVFVYEADVPARQVAAGALRQIIRRFFSGSVEQMLVGMVDEKVLSAADLERLARKVKARQ